MHRHMRTTIDMPDELLERVKPLLISRKMTLRALVIDAVERAVAAPSVEFKLRDASAGASASGKGVSGEAINRLIDKLREPTFPG